MAQSFSSVLAVYSLFKDIKPTAIEPTPIIYNTQIAYMPTQPPTDWPTPTALEMMLEPTQTAYPTRLPPTTYPTAVSTQGPGLMDYIPTGEGAWVLWGAGCLTCATPLVLGALGYTLLNSRRQQ